MMNTPASSHWFSLAFPPERFQPLQVKLSNESVKTGIWTGATWWCDGTEVNPRAWRPLYAQELAC